MSEHLAIDISICRHCLVSIRAVDGEEFVALLHTIAPRTEFGYHGQAGFLISKLSEEQISELNIRSDNLFWEDDYDSVYVIQDLWDDALLILEQVVPNATITEMFEFSCSFIDPTAVDRLQEKLAAHPKLFYAVVNFEEN